MVKLIDKKCESLSESLREQICAVKSFTTKAFDIHLNVYQYGRHVTIQQKLPEFETKLSLLFGAIFA
jgi:hypothetical protein